MPITLKIPPRYIAGDRVMLPCHRTPDRYTMPIPVSLLSDEAAALLVYRELDDGWERRERDLLDEVVRPGTVFVDVGAHWGIHTLHAATAGAVVVAIEPDPLNRWMLAGWLAVNRLSDRVKVVDAAMSDHAGTAYLRRNTSMGHVLVPDPPDPDAVYDRGPFTGQRVFASIRILRLDDLPLPVDGPVVLKIDVEGGERAVLQGAETLLASGRVTHAIWEINDAFDAIDSLLSGYGFRSVVLDTGNALSTRG